MKSSGRQLSRRMSDVSVRKNMLKGINSPTSNINKSNHLNHNANKNFWDSSRNMKQVCSKNNSHADLTTKKSFGVNSNPSSPKRFNAFSPLRRNELNRSEIMRSSSSAMKSTSSKEWINLRARPIIIDDGKPLFGMFSYKIQPTFYPKPRQVLFGKGKHKSWVDIETKKKADIPDPGKYVIKEKENNKLKFLKAKRITEVEEAVKQNMWKLAPGVHYNEKPGDQTYTRKIKGLLDSKAPKLAYMDDAIAQGQATPSHIYKTDSILTVKRPVFGSFSRGVSRKDLKIGKIPATSKEYKHVEAYNKTQVKNRACLFHKTEHKKYTEKAALSKSFVPGVGTYKKFEESFNQLSPKPKALRRWRR